MHRTIRQMCFPLLGTCLVLVMSGLSGTSRAQEVPKTVVVPYNGTYTHQIDSKKLIKGTKSVPAEVIGFRAVENDPTRIMLLGLSAGKARVELTDVDNHVEVLEVVVQPNIDNLRAQLRHAIPTGSIVATSMSGD